MARKKHGQQDRDGGAFLAVPMAVLNSAAYISLCPSAKALLWDMAAQLRMENNGDLTIAMKVMEKRGWKSETTIHKAKKELLESGLLFLTRQGMRPNKASLFAVTWRKLDFCGGKLDISPASFPRGEYLKSKLQSDPQKLE